MTPEDVVRVFETLLKDVYQQDPATCREGDGWWRFGVDGLNFQGGLRGNEFRISASLGPLNTDPDVIDSIWADIKSANAKLGATTAVIAEEDCYLKVKASLRLRDADPKALKDGIGACVTLAQTPEARRVRTRWMAD